MESPIEGKVFGLKGKSGDPTELLLQDKHTANENQETLEENQEQAPIQIDLDNIPQTLKELGDLLGYWRSKREGKSPSHAERTVHKLIDAVEKYQNLADAGESEETLDAAIQEIQGAADIYTQQILGDSGEEGFNEEQMDKAPRGPSAPQDTAVDKPISPTEKRFDLDNNLQTEEALKSLEAELAQDRRSQEAAGQNTHTPKGEVAESLIEKITRHDKLRTETRRGIIKKRKQSERDIESTRVDYQNLLTKTARMEELRDSDLAGDISERKQIEKEIEQIHQRHKEFNDAALTAREAAAQGDAQQETPVIPPTEPHVDETVLNAAKRAPGGARRESPRAEEKNEAEPETATGTKKAPKKTSKPRTTAAKAGVTRHANQKNRQGDESISAQTGDHSPVNINVDRSDRSIRFDGAPLDLKIDVPVKTMEGTPLQATQSLSPNQDAAQGVRDPGLSVTITNPTNPDVQTSVAATPNIPTKNSGREMVDGDLGTYTETRETPKKKRGLSVTEGVLGSPEIHVGDVSRDDSSANVSFTYTPTETFPGGRIVTQPIDDRSIPPAPREPDAPTSPRNTGPRTGAQLLKEMLASEDANKTLNNVAAARDEVSKEEGLLRRMGKSVFRRFTTLEGDKALKKAREKLAGNEDKYLKLFGEKNQEAFEKDKTRITAALAKAEAIFEASAKTPTDKEKFETRKKRIGALQHRSRGELAKTSAEGSMRMIADERLRLAQEKLAKTPKYKKVLLGALSAYGRLPLTGRIAVGAGLAAGGALAITGVPVILATAASVSAVGASTLAGWVNSKWAEHAQKGRRVRAQKETAATLEKLAGTERAGGTSTLDDSRDVLMLAIQQDKKNERAIKREKRVKIITQVAVAAGTAIGVAGLPKWTGLDSPSITTTPTPLDPNTFPSTSSIDNAIANAPKRGVAPLTEPPPGSVVIPDETPKFPNDPGYPPPPAASRPPVFPNDPGYNPREVGPTTPHNPHKGIGLAEPSDQAFPNETQKDYSIYTGETPKDAPFPFAKETIPPAPDTPTGPTRTVPENSGGTPPAAPRAAEPVPPAAPPVPTPHAPGPFDQLYTVKPGDNTWNIISRKLQEAGEFDGLSPAQKNNLIQRYEDILTDVARLRPNDLKELGFKSGNIGRINPGDTLDLRFLDQHLLNPEPSLANKPAGAQPPTVRTGAPQPPAPSAPAAPQTVTVAGDVSPTAPPPTAAEVRAEVSGIVNETLGRKGVFNFLDRIGNADPAGDRFYKFVNSKSPALFLNLRPGASVFGLDPNDVLKVRGIITEAQHLNINVRTTPTMGQLYEEVAKARLGQRT